MSLTRLPKAVEYAIKVLVCLTLFGKTPMPASLVALRVRMPLSQAAKILNYLSLRGMIRSRRGSHGGYELRESPENIRVQQVIALFERAREEDTAATTDPLLKLWSEASDRYWQEFEHLTIAEVARRIAPEFEAMSQT